MKSIILGCLLVISGGFAQAQDAKALLDEVSAKVRSYDNIVIDFKYSLNNEKQKVKQDTRGNVTLQGDKYHLNMLGTTRISDGKYIYSIVPEDEEVTISTIGSDEKSGIRNRIW